jgi:ornithine cyclodeaminase/alanine dehydrogenase-like protein (mu-crystallin family)
MDGSQSAGRGAAPGVPALRYLSTAQVEECLPDVLGRVALARRALVALARADAEMPPKIGVHPREGALLHAMPAWLRSDDIVGLKWVSAFPANAGRRMAAISGLVVLNDAETGVPTWIMDAARITALRTAAVSGVAIELFAAQHAERVALLGVGVQARSHLEVIAELLPRATVALYNRTTSRATQIADELNGADGRRLVRVAHSAADAVRDAHVVISVATLGAPAERLRPADLSPGALVIAVDFATYASPELARAARPFVVDDRAQFLHYRQLGYFDGYPKPTTTLGEAADSGAAPDALRRTRRHRRPTLVTHLGVGLADVVFADAIARAASESGAGVELER